MAEPFSYLLRGTTPLKFGLLVLTANTKGCNRGRYAHAAWRRIKLGSTCRRHTNGDLSAQGNNCAILP